ncbi:MAG TPA: hypothetical protein VKS79_18255 [Gemmataceae bacterium]|nr:hypothetical protein [Gemmataceae bacterium]
MRNHWVTICMLGGLALAGCRSGNSPYANDPTLLYYKPTLSDSASVLAERTSRREPVKPAMPVLAQKSQPLPPMDPTPGPEPEREVQPVSATEMKPLTANNEIRPLTGNVVNAQAIAPLEPTGIKPLTNALPAPPLVAAPAPQLLAANLPTAEVASQPVVAKLPAKVEPPLAAKPPVPQMPPPPPVLSHQMPAKNVDVHGPYAHDPEYHWLQGVLEKSFKGYYCLRYADSSVEDPHGGKMRLVDDPRLSQFRDGDVLRIEGEMVPDAEDNPRARWESPYYRMKSAEIVQKIGTEK